ncbi:GNAT family protein [Colletotrichum tofieldiae]|uniref:GNAT family protein n=1 Tax=Colletotrichum tofieldiae TaxID=708197 RepID=A0A166R601_9PEZI|nr:GNAT family protein [Colletotrichum tofieldiae]GKT84285.1 GNAT family protein [Colletotrichum tofieldiae]
MSSTNFTIITLPKSHPDPSTFHHLTTLYKSFRLLSLRLSPESFGSTYAREVAFPWGTWTSRLENPLATTVVAYESPPLHPSPALDDGMTPDGALVKSEGRDAAMSAEWLAHLTLMGPLDPSALATSLHLDPDLVDFGPAHAADKPNRQYVLNGMYVIPSARGKRLGRRILEYARDLVASEAKSHGQNARVSLIVDYDNVSARRTYERSGFEIVHRYWFDDYREGREARTEAAVMVQDLGGEGVQHGADNS